MSARLRIGAGASPRYCGVCGGLITAMRPESCAGGTPHIPEPDMETAQPARNNGVDPASGTRADSWSTPDALTPPLSTPHPERTP